MTVGLSNIAEVFIDVSFTACELFKFTVCMDSGVANVI